MQEKSLAAGGSCRDFLRSHRRRQCAKKRDQNLLNYARNGKRRDQNLVNNAASHKQNRLIGGLKESKPRIYAGTAHFFVVKMFLN